MTQPPYQYSPTEMREMLVVTWMLNQAADAGESLAALRAVIQQAVDDSTRTHVESLDAIITAAGLWPKGEQVPASATGEPVPPVTQTGVASPTLTGCAAPVPPLYAGQFTDARVRPTQGEPVHPQWRCTLCGCLWREWPDSWSLWDTNQRSCEVCDNSTEFGRVITRVVSSPAERAEQWLRLHANDYSSLGSARNAVLDFVSHNAKTCSYCNPAPEPQGEARLPEPGHTCTYNVPFTPDDKLFAAADMERVMADVPDMLRAEFTIVKRAIAMVEARYTHACSIDEAMWLCDLLAALHGGPDGSL